MPSLRSGWRPATNPQPSREAAKPQKSQKSLLWQRLHRLPSYRLSAYRLTQERCIHAISLSIARLLSRGRSYYIDIRGFSPNLFYYHIFKSFRQDLYLRTTSLAIRGKAWAEAASKRRQKASL